VRGNAREDLFCDDATAARSPNTVHLSHRVREGHRGNRDQKVPLYRLTSVISVRSVVSAVSEQHGASGACKRVAAKDQYLAALGQEEQRDTRVRQRLKLSELRRVKDR
jgi:hypothetical protein